MSVYESSITNPKKQLEFYKQLSEQLQQENQKYKEVIDNIKKIIIDNSYDELYEWFNELREESVIEIVNILDIKKDIEQKRGGINE